MNLLTSGWYHYFVFYLPFHHGLEEAYLVGFWTQDILGNVAIALGLCLFALWPRRTPESGLGVWKRPAADLMILGSLFMASYLSRIHSGGYNNVLMAVYAGIAIYFGIGLDAALKGAARQAIVTLAILGVTMLQFMLLVYSPQQQIPTRADREQGERILQRVASIKGEVYWSDHPWYLEMIGKPMQAQEMAIMDVLRASGSGQWGRHLEQEMAMAVAEGRYAAFVVDFRDFSLRVPDFDDHYELVDTNLSGDSFRMVTGFDRHPRHLYVRRP
jgi:hypothetical protein